jgi:hypothetical protein
MTALILRVRLLINDTQSPPVFFDQDIQDVLDESRVDVLNGTMRYQPTYSGTTILFLDYFTELGGWEDGMLLKQYLTVLVTPSLVEPIAGHFQFAASTFPPVFISGKLYDVYRAAADLLERWAAKWVLRYNVNVDGQGLQRNQVQRGLQTLATTYRKKQRAGTISMMRSDLGGKADQLATALGPQEIDRMASG